MNTMSSVTALHYQHIFGPTKAKPLVDLISFTSQRHQDARLKQKSPTQTIAFLF